MTRYLADLVLYVKQQIEYGRGGTISIKTRRICKEDRKCGRAVNRLMMSLVEKGLVRQHKRGVYLIERRTAEEVLSVLTQQMPVTAVAASRQRKAKKAANP
jgi:predicted transcriptional regulator